MNNEPVPASLDVPLADLAALCVEHWRMAAWLAASPGGAAVSPAAAPARHALRRVDDFLKAREIEARSLDGHPFDPGMAVRVVDTVDDAQLSEGQSVIAETLSPLVLWRGRVLRPADVVTRRGTKR